MSRPKIRSYILLIDLALVSGQSEKLEVGNGTIRFGPLSVVACLSLAQ